MDTQVRVGAGETHEQLVAVAGRLWPEKSGSG